MRHHTRTDFAYSRIPEALLYDPTVTLAAKVVFAVLDRHGHDPSSCYPSHRRIAAVLGMKPASIARPLKELEDSGWIEREARHDDAGARIPDGYRVHVERVLERAHPAPEPGGPRVPEPEPASLLEREPLERGANAPMRGALVSADSSFDDFWAVYPVKLSKKAARTAWDKAVKRADPAAIIAGAVRYRDDPNRDPGHTKYAQGWLNDDRWTDPPLPPRNGDRPKSRMNRTFDNLAPFMEESDEPARNGNGVGAPRRGLPTGGRAGPGSGVGADPGPLPLQ